MAELDKNVGDGATAAQKLAQEMFRREALSAKVFRSIARRMPQEQADILTEVAAEKEEAAQILSAYAGGKTKASRTSRLWWKLVSRIFGASFAISRLEVAEAETRPYFSATVDEIPEAAKICAQGEAQRQRLASLIDAQAMQRLGGVVSGLYDVFILQLASIVGFAVFFKNATTAAGAGICVGVASLISSVIRGFSSLSSDSTFARRVFAGVLAALVSLIITYLLVAPWPSHGGLAFAFALSAIGAVVVLTVLSYFAAVARQKNWSAVWGKMIVHTCAYVLVSLVLMYALRFVFPLGA